MSIYHHPDFLLGHVSVKVSSFLKDCNEGTTVGCPKLILPCKESVINKIKMLKEIVGCVVYQLNHGVKIEMPSP